MNMKHLVLFFIGLLYFFQVANGDSVDPLATGEGSSLPFPLYNRLIFGWDQRDPTNTVTYSQTSATSGINSLIGPKSERRTFWAGAEVMPTEEQINTSIANGRKLSYHPSALISLMPYVNYDSLGGTAQLKMTPLTFGMIWIGTISRRNDPILVETNPFLASVDQPIMLVTAVSKSGTYGIFQQSLLNMLPPGMWPYPVRTDGTWSPEHLAVLGDRVVYAPIGNPPTFATIYETPYSMGIVSQSLLLQMGVSVKSFAFLSSSDQEIIPDSAGLLAASETIVVTATGSVVTNVSIPDGIWPIYGYTYIYIDSNYSGYTPEECDTLLELWDYFRWILLDPSVRVEALAIGTAMLKYSVA
jgi:phosphate transport system substrate-binding protein